MEDAGACAGAFLLEAGGAVEAIWFLVGWRVVVGLGPLVIIVVVIVLIPPRQNLHLQLPQPLPNRLPRPIRLPKRSEAAPSQRLNTRNREIIDRKLREKRDVRALKRKSQRQECLKSILLRRSETQTS